MISHDNMTYTVKKVFDTLSTPCHTDRFISYLPLSHIASICFDIYAPMYAGGATYFAQPDALKGSLKRTLLEVQPSYFFGVPRVWEKIHEGMLEHERKKVSGISSLILRWAKNVGTCHSLVSQYGNTGGLPWGYRWMKALVFDKIKQALGFKNVKACFCGAAPISAETVSYFASLDIPIYEVFGQSECAGTTHPDRIFFYITYFYWL